MVESLIITVLVVWSAIVVFKKVFPQTSNTVFLKLATWCEQQHWQTLAKWLKPKMAAGCAGGCGCSASDNAPLKKAEIKPVKWH